MFLSMMLLKTQPEAITIDIPMRLDARTAISICPLEARKKPPVTDTRLQNTIPGLATSMYFLIAFDIVTLCDNSDDT